jgi:hypothetical protein
MMRPESFYYSGYPIAEDPYDAAIGTERNGPALDIVMHDEKLQADERAALTGRRRERKAGVDGPGRSARFYNEIVDANVSGAHIPPWLSDAAHTAHGELTIGFTDRRDQPGAPLLETQDPGDRYRLW